MTHSTTHAIVVHTKRDMDRVWEGLPVRSYCGRTVELHRASLNWYAVTCKHCLNRKPAAEEVAELDPS